VSDREEVQPAAESATLSILRIRPALIVNSNSAPSATRHPHRTDGAIDERVNGFAVGDEIIVIIWFHRARQDVLQVRSAHRRSPL
jgi:hypothetical protein